MPDLWQTGLERAEAEGGVSYPYVPMLDVVRHSLIAAGQRIDMAQQQLGARITRLEEHVARLERSGELARQVPTD